jgi:tRNA threonylcarbamoyladenosine biosynthesis protein TsaE
MQDNMHQQFTGITIDTLQALANNFIANCKEKIWLMQGQMGAGKTTFTKALCRALSVSDTMSSPTFAIVNEYKTTHNDTIYHFDFYRIKSQEEAYDIGVEEYFYSGRYCFIEWGDKIPDLLPERYVRVDIQIESETQRTISLETHG